ncbi:hypothetical protein [Streptomyces sp. SGAir0957]
MTTAAPTSVDWIRLKVGDEELAVEPAPGILLHLHVGPPPAPDFDGAPFAIAPSGLGVALYLEPRDSSDEIRCGNEVRRVQQFLGSLNPDLRTALPAFSLHAAISGEAAPYNRVRVPRLALGGEPPEGMEPPAHAMQVFVARAREVDGTLYEISAA